MVEVVVTPECFFEPSWGVGDLGGERSVFHQVDGGFDFFDSVGDDFPPIFF